MVVGGLDKSSGGLVDETSSVAGGGGSVLRFRGCDPGLSIHLVHTCNFEERDKGLGVRIGSRSAAR